MSIKTAIFGTLPSGQDVSVYTIKNDNGVEVSVIPYGCRIIKLLTPDRYGKLDDVILGHSTLAEYTDSASNYHGALIGRYANRIKGGRFSIDGTSYQVLQNDGENSLHGGPNGYHSVLWDVVDLCDNASTSITFAHLSPDGDAGFPGSLQMQVRYTLTSDNTLEITYIAQTDKKTIFNPTNHAFFNLSGNHSNQILNTELQIFASRYTSVSADLIPTGELLETSGTPMDFTAPKTIGADIFAVDPSLKSFGGYDHNFCADGTGYRVIASAYEPESGRVMEVMTDLPGVQLYTFNSEVDTVNKDGSSMKPHSSFCLETQFYPDSPNQSHFPFSYVEPSTIFQSMTGYRFSAK